MKRKNIFWGIALIAIAVIWIITKLDIFPGVQFGKIAFTLLWAAWLVKGILDRGFFSIFMSIAFLGIVWQHELKIEYHSMAGCRLGNIVKYRIFTYIWKQGKT